MYPDFSLKKYAQELFRPWKIVTFILALFYYVWGALYYRLPTWDVPVSIIMSILTYIFAPATVLSLMYLFNSRPKGWVIKVIVCLGIIYGCASGSYEIYHMFWGIKRHPPTYWPNLWYSSLIFLAAGIFWKFEGSFLELCHKVWQDFKQGYQANRLLFLATSFVLAFLLVWGVYYAHQIQRL